MVSKLSRQDGVVSVFQVGSIGTPGISDIDMLVVFEDGSRCDINPRESLSTTERYLFSHALYGASKTQFIDAQKYAVFHSCNLLYGDEITFRQNDLSEHQARNLKAQIALEYLIKMFVDSCIELTYGIVKTRGLLMHTKALLYDLKFLDVSSGELFTLVQTITAWRDRWFQDKQNNQKLRKWFIDFHASLTEFITEELSRREFYLPACTEVHIARNVTIEPSETFGYTHVGLRLPNIFGFLGRKYFNVQHRFNRFQFRIPAALSNMPDIIRDRFIFASQMKHDNRELLPHFMPLTSSLNILSHITKQNDV